MTHDDDTTLESAAASESNWRTWLIGALFTIAMALTGLGYASMDRRLSILEDQGTPASREQIAAIKARQDALQRQIDSDVQGLKETTKRIEDKVDRLLEERRVRTP